ncbi:MAG: hypothetical protein LIP02_04470 [Bacteroidales bacterium]|nr:hypothetical protein [Bacteroidales bacterium]
MTQLLLTIEDESKVSALKKVLQMMDGVYVTKPHKKRKTGLDLAFEDVAAGRVTKWNSVEEMFEKLNIPI